MALRMHLALCLRRNSGSIFHVDSCVNYDHSTLHTQANSSPACRYKDSSILYA